jgi:hypothetical protein
MQASHWLHRIAGALIFCSLSTAPLVAADKRPFASSDFTSLRSAMPVAISPDGKAILFDVHFFNEKGPVKHEWHTVPAASGGALKLDLPEKFTPSGFTRDGSLLGEYRIDDQTQLAIVPITSGKPTVIFTLPRGGHFTRRREDRRPSGRSNKGQKRSAQRRRERRGKRVCLRSAF